MAGPAQKRYTEAEYLALERASEEKHEFLNGEIYAMAGASREHVYITTNLIAELRQRLKGGPCRPFVSDMRVKVQASGLNTYPDASVVCGEPEFEDDQVDTLVNPQVVFEILSPSTERYDRGVKFKLYQEQGTISDVIFIAHSQVAVEHYRRLDDGHWDYKLYSQTEEAAAIASISCELPLRELYDGVQFHPTNRSEK